MRYFMGFVFFLLTLGTLRVVGCGDEEANRCDDGNECTKDVYLLNADECSYFPRHKEPCNFDGVPGRCDYQTCKEDLCVNVNCDDGDICSEDHCDFTTGKCHYYNAGFGGEPCTRNGLPGFCSTTYCRTFDCDDGDLCTKDWCDVHETPEGARYDECKSFPDDCSDSNLCTDDTCDPETGCIHTSLPDGVSPYPPSSLVCCNGILCWDDNECTSDTCDLETRECAYIPVPEGERCCPREEERCGICIPGPCCHWVCVYWGSCNSGVCE